MTELGFGSMVEWIGGQKCMVVAVDPPVFFQITATDDPIDAPSGEPESSSYPFNDGKSWSLIDD